MPIDPHCQPFATTIATLETQRDAVKATLPPLSPADRWTALASIGDLERQVADQQRQLDECQRLYAAAYEADVVIFDTTGSPPATRIARLWQMDSGPPTILQEVQLQAGTLTFSPPPSGTSLGLTIQESGNPAVQGVDFRFGPIGELPRKAPDDPSGRIEIVVGPDIAFASDEIAGWLAGTSLPQHTTTPLPGDVPGTLELTVATLGVTLGVNVVQLNASGTANVTGPLWGSQLMPFDLDLPLRFALPTTPDADRVCDLVIAGSPNLSATGPLGSVLTAVAPFFRTFVAELGLPELRNALNSVIPPSVAAGFGLEEFPSGTVVSLRHFQITPAAVTIVPSLGALGEVLSSFQP